MSGNRFGVGQLWDGVKQAVTDAFNTVAQTFTGTLKQVFSLTTKYLPQINLIVKVVAYLPGLIGAVSDLVKRLPGVFQEGQKSAQGFIKGLIGNLQGFVKGALRAAEISIKSAVRLVERAVSREFSKLPKTVQSLVKNTLKAIIDPVKGTLKAVNNQIQRIITEFAKIKSLFKTELSKFGGEIQKYLNKQKAGILSEIRPVINDLAKRLKSTVDGALKPIKDSISSIIKEVKFVVQQVTRDIDNKVKGLIGGVSDNVKRLPKAIDDAGKGVSKTVGTTINTTIAGIKDSLKATEKRLDDLIQKGAKAATQKVDEVGKVANRTATQLSELPKKVVAEVVEEVPKRLKPAFQSIEAAVKAPIVLVQKSVEGVGKEVGRVGQETVKVVTKEVEAVGKNVSKIAQQADDTAKVVTKVLPFLDDIIKIALNAAPIIDGFADYMQFEELKLLLETIQERQKNDFETLVSTQINTTRLISKVEKLESRLGIGDNTVKVDLNPVLNAIAALPKTGGIASNAEIAAAVAAKIPKPDTIAIADAVAAKIPKQIDNTAILTKTIQDAIKAAPPGQTVSSEAIAAAVAAKIPKPETATTIAIAVKEKMGPEFKAISEKLPDNGIYRVDQTGIAVAVKEKMGPEFKAIQPTKIPPDLARKSDLNITVNPTPVTVKPTPVTVNPTPVTVSIPPTDLSPIDTQLKDISKAIGVEQLKNAAPVDAEKLIKKAGEQQFAGGSVQGATTLAGLMAAFAAPQFFRSGSHRLGGSFDQSLMNPAAGKVQINDAMGYKDWQFKQLDERLGMPTQMQVVGQAGVTQTRQFRSIQDSVEEINGVSVSNAQDLEIVERYLFALTQDIQKLMQIALQTREDVDVLIDDSGCKTKEVKRSHPTHIKLTSPGETSSLTNMFQQGQVHYVAREWADSADKNQKLERMSYDTQIAAMSNKFEFDKAAPELPLQKSRATDKPVNDELWRTYVSTMEEPPEGYTTPGNPRPDIKEIKNGNPVDVPKPTNPLKKLGKPS